MNNEQQIAKVKKTVKITGAALLALIIGYNCFTVVSDGTVKTQKFLGRVADKPLLPGPHLINPLATLEEFNTRDIALKFNKLQVPSQDKFKSTVDITVMLQFDGNKAPMNLINAGSQDAALNKYVEEKLLSTIREFGKSVKKAQDLYNADIQAQLQTSIQQEVEGYSRPYGYTVKQVFLQDIELPEVIKKQVENTKIREELVNAAQADLDRVDKEAQQAVKRAESERKASEQRAIAGERNADAKLYAAKKEAEANRALQSTITQEMITWKKLDVEMLYAKEYKGGVPTTVVGSDYKGGLFIGGAVPLVK